MSYNFNFILLLGNTIIMKNYDVAKPSKQAAPWEQIPGSQLRSNNGLHNTVSLQEANSGLEE